MVGYSIVRKLLFIASVAAGSLSAAALPPAEEPAVDAEWAVQRERLDTFAYTNETYLLRRNMPVENQKGLNKFIGKWLPAR